MTQELAGPGGSGKIQPLGNIFLEGGGINFEALELPETATMKEIRQAVLKKGGKIKSRGRKAETLTEAERAKRKEERKVAAKERRDEKNAWLRSLSPDLAPKPRGPKLTDEERVARRSARAKKRREEKKEEEQQLLNFAKKNKQDLKKMGLDPSAFKYLKF